MPPTPRRRLSAVVGGEWLSFKAKSWDPASLRKAHYVCNEYLFPTLGERRCSAGRTGWRPWPIRR